ncbi:hypothetical protein AVEN_216462-1 [Araneus ventricosus]|uniref:Uncharacterized protein n=1 Tax=Araneus ventricosus TaxID=182803 RepID=A0A4Y2BNC4_ARAVE|nr:hypothetical protein AVEN_216462-1 [Araneus ventricosus]
MVRPIFLVVRSRPRDRKAPGLKSDSAEDPQCMWACCMSNHMQVAKRPLAGMTRDLEDGGFQFRCRPSSASGLKLRSPS